MAGRRRRGRRRCAVLGDREDAGVARGGRRKNDVIDAAAAASVAALQGDANPVVAEDLTTVLALLDERRNNVITQRTRLVNQLHALLRDLVPGGAPTDLSVVTASRLLTGIRPAGPVEAARKQLAPDLIVEIRDADQRLKVFTAQIADMVAATGSRLSEVDGVGPVIAGRLLARTRRPADSLPRRRSLAMQGSPRSRFPAPNESVIACLAVVTVSSTSPLHIVALTRVRMRGSSGRAYYDTKIAARKTHNEAMRCLKRRLADHIWRIMIRDEHEQSAGPGGHSGATTQSSAAGSTPATSSSDKSLPEPAITDSTTGRTAA